MQYLLAVHSRRGRAAPSDEEMQTAFAQVDQVNDEMQAAGAWVFGGGLLPAGQRHRRPGRRTAPPP